MTEVEQKRPRVDDEVMTDAPSIPSTSTPEAPPPEARCMVQLMSEAGEALGGALDVGTSTTQAQLQQICNMIMKDKSTDGEEYEAVPCQFYLDKELIGSDLSTAISTVSARIVDYDLEQVLTVVYEPQAIFRCIPVTRCTASLPGHAESVVSVQFSPDARYLASGSGDCTVRFWDLSTELPHHTCEGHKGWVLCMSWSPEGTKLASACKMGQVRVWCPETGKQLGNTLLGHKQWITSLAWQPLHEAGESRYLASAGKDGTIKIWDTVMYKCERTLSSHTACVTAIRWGGEGLLYSASQDRTIKVWRVKDGVLCRTLAGHGHWVNTMALHTDYVLRIGAYNPKHAQYVAESQTAGKSKEEVMKMARRRYEEVMEKDGTRCERMVSGSDDFTLFLWHAATDKKPIARLTGHMQLVNQVQFSCDGRVIASASFDKSIKLWDGRTGKYLNTLRGHVQAVYQIAFAPDSRLLVSGSKDSTLKVWDVLKGALKCDLPGHGDEVYAVDWSPDGQRVVSGAKDKLLRIWRR